VIADKKSPAIGKLLRRVRLSKEGSAKSVYLIGIEAGEELAYEPGDWLTVFPQNPPDQVRRLAKLLHGAELDRLARDFTILDIHRPLVQWILENAAKGEARTQLLQWLEGDFSARARGSVVADVLEQFANVPLAAEDLQANIRPLQPRLYSIASAPAVNPNAIELVVASALYTGPGGKCHEGAASSFLNKYLPLGGEVPMRVTKTHFRLPADPRTDVIFVGPGTGIAPFRGFLQHRDFLQKNDTILGRCWLFFGDQHRATDYIFEEDLNAYQRSGVLSRLDLAFSRDQDHKIYVQDRIWESRGEIWKWLEGGAHVYVCGTANPMARDVLETFVKITNVCGNLSEEDARDYVKALQKSRRYSQDIY
jgi:sulfite reductase (NADPH) flavoprotein alpha-component